MKILYIDYNMFGKEDIIGAFIKLGHEVDIVDAPLRFGENSVKTRQILQNTIHKKEYDVVFTSNYYPMVSNICNAVSVNYVSWTYDSPRIVLYDRSINNQCNYAFVFDSEECRRLRGRGVERVYYMPLGVNTERVDSIVIADRDKRLFSTDVSIVASLYNEEHNLYDRMYSKVDDYTKGYLEALVNAQRNVFGGNILEASLDDTIIDVLKQYAPYELDKECLADHRYIYANYFLARKTATYQRKDFIRSISEKYELKVYTPGDIKDIPNAIHMGTVDYNTDMNKVFKLSKININITLPSIRSGIPLRALDIMGAGGFLLTDYRADFEGALEPGVDYVYYTDIDDAMYKIEYYLNHEKARAVIAGNGKQKVEQGFTYMARIKDMLEIVNE